MVFRTILTALLAGFLAGICLFLVQRAWTLPLIRAAETYEKASSVESVADEFAKEPLRSVATLLGDVFVAIGFGLILSGIYAVSGWHGWLSGLLLGLVGFATFQVAPALVAPPAVPGMEVASLAFRQAEWWFAVASAVIGCILLLKLKGWTKLAGALLFVLPAITFRYVLGLSAPTTPLRSLAVIDRDFMLHTFGAMLVFWVILGAVSGHVFALGDRTTPGCRYRNFRPE